MAFIITEIYVSADGSENYTKLDLHRNESVNRKYTQKDLQDLSRVFAPYSQRFTFPATTKNRKAFGFFGNTDAIKTNTTSKFKAKTYINGILFSTGFIKLSKLSYKNLKPRDFTGTFTSTMENLQNKIGDDLISELSTEDALIQWDLQSVKTTLQSSQTKVVDGVNIKYFTPLVSLNRVWAYDTTDSGQVLDNIFYNAANDINGTDLIRPEELRPCISYKSILDLIKFKYNLDIISPLENREELEDLRVWCNSELISSNDFKVLPIYNAFGAGTRYSDTAGGWASLAGSPKYTITTDLADNTFTVTKDPLAGGGWHEEGFRFDVVLNNVLVSGGLDTAQVDVQYIRSSDDVILKTETFDLDSSGAFFCNSLISDNFFDGNTLTFYVKLRFKQPTSWANCRITLAARYWTDRSAFWYFKDSLGNNNSNEINANSIDLIKTLPKMKVVDFLNSHFKSFNISIFEVSPKDKRLYWLTPEDINSTGKEYSKATLDYTRYATELSEKEKPNDYNYYNFKHFESEYYSNKKYLEAFGIEYGQAVYPEQEPDNANEFVVETDFSIVPPVLVNGAGDLQTFYGFKDETPEVIGTGETRYTPNYDELTLFYTHGSETCLALSILGYPQTLIDDGTGNLVTVSNVLGIDSLTSYIKVLPWSKNGYSLGFSVLKYQNTEYTNTIYLRYYESQTARLLNPNVLAQKFTLTLPPDEIYLNEATTIQGSGDTPKGFRLQNDIIIRENLFSIVDATIDQTTGKTTITLLNY